MVPLTIQINFIKLLERPVAFGKLTNFCYHQSNSFNIALKKIIKLNDLG